MIEVTVESIRVSLINQQRLVVLRESHNPRYLPIWIGPFEAEAITMGLQGTDAGRPMTHDLLRNVITELGAEPNHIYISDLQDETFFARLVVHLNGQEIEIDSRPSDAIALAVRLGTPIFVSEQVMERAGQVPAEQIDDDQPIGEGVTESDDDPLDVFRSFVEGLDIGVSDEPDDADDSGAADAADDSPDSSESDDADDSGDADAADDSPDSSESNDADDSVDSGAADDSPDSSESDDADDSVDSGAADVPTKPDEPDTPTVS